ncbi:hypothetical protein [Arthrobacter sp. B3I4]|uniref:hypothetical protein n=1 Tax=Arthrobacter sp. B3I4 TaxID=3042267 RepID=UPI002782AFFE|nr:hypothetical protein [Arthrobacter sp. B3I4]MDQ0755657.1 hypothetical protein [Arthrobacter sp. B3I4]
MAQLKHLLRGLSCKYFGRPSRRARLAAALLAGKAHERRRNHLERCTACRARQQRERQYLERLRGAAVPEASEDLTARLLARTGELATRSDGDSPAPAAVQPATPAPVLKQRPAPVTPKRLPLALGIGGGVAAGALLLGGAAYLLGAEVAPTSDGAFASAAGAAFPGRMTGQAVPPDSAFGSAWKLSGEPDVAPAGALSAGQLAGLRAQGWTCPELRELGYHLVWARSGIAYGTKVLELRLTDGRHFATVLEQHSGDGGRRSGPAAGPGRAAAVPVNVLTGHPASDDGFTAAPLVPDKPDTAATDAEQPQPAPAEGVLWVNARAPFRAIYATPAATFTYVSDLPDEQAGAGVDALVRSRPTASPAAPGGGALPTRLERGLQRLAELLAR